MFEVLTRTTKEVNLIDKKEKKKRQAQLFLFADSMSSSLRAPNLHQKPQA
jgi:hypothetical protein